MTVWQMYWLVKMDDISGRLFAITVLGGCALLFGWVGCFVDANDPVLILEPLRRLIRRFTYAWLVCLTLVILLPNTKQLAAIILVPKLVNSEVVQRDIPQVYDLAVEWMKTKLAVPEAKVEK